MASPHLTSPQLTSSFAHIPERRIAQCQEPPVTLLLALSPDLRQELRPLTGAYNPGETYSRREAGEGE